MDEMNDLMVMTSGADGVEFVTYGEIEVGEDYIDCWVIQSEDSIPIHRKGWHPGNHWDPVVLFVNDFETAIKVI